jgi:hypothetical protein
LMAVPASGGSPSAFVIADSSNAVDFHDPIALPGGRGLVTAVHRQQGIDTIGLVSRCGESRRGTCRTPAIRRRVICW